MCEPEFFLLYAKKDDSFSVVPSSDVLFVPPIRVNDKVKFYFTADGVRALFSGIVKEFGDDFKTLTDRLPYWNKTRKVCNRGSNRTFSKRRRKQRSQKGKRLSLDSGSDTNLNATDESDSASGPELTQEEMNLLVKEAKQKRKSDLKSLSNLSSKRHHNIFSDSEDEQPLSRVAKKSAPEQLVAESSNSPQSLGRSHSHHETTPLWSSSNSPSTSPTPTQIAVRDPDSPDDSDSAVTVPRRKRRMYQKLVFNGIYYRFKEEDEGVVQLWSDYKVYVDTIELKRIKRESKTGPMMARLLLKAIYTPAACSECSPTGRPSGVSKQQRPPLHPDGINAAHDFINKRAEKRHWPPVTLTSVKKAFSDVLCEDRYTAKLLAEERIRVEKNAAVANATAALVVPSVNLPAGMVTLCLSTALLVICLSRETEMARAVDKRIKCPSLTTDTDALRYYENEMDC
ncbi:Putative BEN domain-containing protein B1 [Frankliniella fusca]|uniref:BEN domain-containing protein B1 n=1 Tax=Frankliniella fusca TaxID=407009 RepID=A0AAE1HS20_9NEOP|nr:Putative BEN domain-containing protein B1 [Frankliniella fusca]